MSAVDVEDLLEPGEAVEARVAVGSSRVFVTGRRVLAFTPETEGRNYRAIDRPNVDGVGVHTRSHGAHLWRTAGLLVAGAALVGVGLLFDTDGFLAVETGPGAGALGVSGPIRTVRSLVGLVDDAALYAGALVALVGLAFAGLYVRSRTEVVAIGVAGAPDLDLPAATVDDPRDAVGRIREALGVAVDPAGREGGGRVRE
jgi:hypothetical protein